MTEDSDDRSPHAIAYHWAARIMTVGLEMVLPGVVGLLVDRWLGSTVVFTLIGFAAGMGMGMVHLQRLAKQFSSDQADSKSATKERPDQ